jgi:Domain of unknown function (DUF4382)/Carboxypeptidase regulatory-like domain
MEKLLLLLLLSSLFTACGMQKKIDNFLKMSSFMPNGLTGIKTTKNFSLTATDAPFSYAFVTSAKMTVKKVEMRDSKGVYHQSLKENTVMDLILLRNGMYSTLTEQDLPDGQYDEIKVYVSAASVTLIDGRTFDLTVPVGALNGVSVALSPTLQISSSTQSYILLDIDLSRSYLPQGITTDVATVTGFDFFPVIRAANLATAGAIGGIIYSTDQQPVPGAIVEITQGSVSSTAVTGSDGVFLIMGVTPGTYQIGVSAVGYQDKAKSSITVESASPEPFTAVLSRN